MEAAESPELHPAAGTPLTRRSFLAASAVGLTTLRQRHPVTIGVQSYSFRDRSLGDAIAGMQLPSDSDEAVANILIDLAQRETHGHSLGLAKSIVAQMGPSNLHHKAMKSAGFRVLKAPDVPSVLLELGYLSNPEDEKRLTSDSWRAKIADKVAAAIDAYFTKRVAQTPF